MNRSRAGLLWLLLGPGGRRAISPELEVTQLQELNQAAADYRRLKAPAQKEIQRDLGQILSARHSPLLAILTFLLLLTTGAMFSYHSLHFSMSPLTRWTLFTPWIFASLAPLALYFLPAYRARLLFRWQIDATGILTTFAMSIALIWTLAFIGMQDKGPVMKLTGIHFWILASGAVTAPLLEEILFRELIPGMVGRSPHFAGHILSALLFTALHLPSTLLMGWLYFMAAALLALIRIQTDGLLYPLLAHALANGTIVVLDSW
ncbi:MAG: CPBP family intramembrane metalloprotease [Spirochaetales bacterium]|nr:CPBP family intramembrane metalloprotease [Spirochaetales bacterium]